MPSPSPAPAAPADGKKTTANITIDLPAGAALSVDGQPVMSAGAVRRFHTPELPAGQSFFYDMKAELLIGGQTVTEELRVVVHAGDAVTASFGKLLAAAAGTDKAVATK
jgi:uncharacterized protein (TIGR03000 family)